MQWSAMEWIDGMQCSGVEWNGCILVILALLIFVGYLLVVFNQKRTKRELFDAPQAYQRSVPD